MRHPNPGQYIAQLKRELEEIEKFLRRGEDDPMGTIETPSHRKARRREQEILEELERY